MYLLDNQQTIDGGGSNVSGITGVISPKTVGGGVLPAIPTPAPVKSNPSGNTNISLIPVNTNGGGSSPINDVPLNTVNAVDLLDPSPMPKITLGTPETLGGLSGNVQNSLGGGAQDPGIIASSELPTASNHKWLLWLIIIAVVIIAIVYFSKNKKK